MIIPEMSLRNALIASVIGHLLLVLFFSLNASHVRPVLVNESRNEPGQILPKIDPTPAQPEIVKAVAVDNQEVKEVVDRLKAERAHQQQLEKAHQQQLAQQAEAARLQRVREEQRLIKLKNDSEKLAIARKKQMEEEQKRLNEMVAQKEKESKRLEAMKREQVDLQKKQQEEAKKLAAIQQKQAESKAQKEKAALAAAEAVKSAAEAAKRAEAAARQAQINATNQARVAGEVDKYKALIIDAIGRQWILPENTNRNLSSQFRIRLAPDGGVMEVSLIRSSGDPILDRSAQTAIYKASPLPVPADPTTFNLFREISLTVRPENVRG